ncbi:MAG TPA: ATP-dependent DNA helicase Rep, partial [Thiotrichales bacterium]|nr:ATP-dependent DNA helicase Rep [Thiotrichales bacterium]
MSLTAKLNPQQLAAVQHTSTPLLVLAGAGSGKTRVITEKIAHLIRQQNYDPRQIAAITFTNKAAREMKARAGKLLKKEERRGLIVSTFHTLGLKIIRSELKNLGYKSGFSIFDSQDSATLLKELSRKEENLDMDEAARWQISRWKNDFINPEQALQETDDAKGQFHARLYAHYQRQLHAYNAMDFDDLIVLPVQLFQSHSEVLEKWQNKLRYLLVDEYQDTNACQYRLVKLLAGPQARLTVVGDDDQSIYAWRGARPENLDLLQHDFPALKIIKLEQNYRSCTRILESANQLIANNPHTIEKKLWSALGEGEALQVIPCNSAEHEAERVVSEILKLKFRHRVNHGDCAILYRGNFQSRLFERYLREQNIPYKVSGGTSFFERAEVKDIVAYLRLITNPDDDAAFLRIVNTPRREIGAATLEKLGAYASDRGVSLFSASFEMGLQQRLTERALMRLQRFTDWINEFNRRAEIDNPVSLVRQLVQEINYESWLSEISSNESISEKRMDNINELIEWIGRLAKKNEQQNLSDIIAHMMLMDILERNSEEQQQDAVQLMTLHAAKGLEFPHVFIAGMEEELIPHKTSLDEDMLEEERRLAYVGITRAQKTLA